jgi:hypothetical protein
MTDARLIQVCRPCSFGPVHANLWLALNTASAKDNLNCPASRGAPRRYGGGHVNAAIGEAGAMIHWMPGH